MSTTNALGRRKAAVARVYLSPGTGKITINGKAHDQYFVVNHLRLKVEQPLKVLGMTTQYDITANVQGGGIMGQADAVKLGIARAMVIIDPELKPKLKVEHLMIRDPRVVERKKPGLRKARKKSQFSKR
jgi:small subunit ribosomal protein S9